MTNFSNSKISSLQALRALAFIGIFLAHVHARFDWSGFGVSLFFALSGFLLMSRHSDLPHTVTESAKYAIHKIMRIYPLHLLTMVAAALIYLVPHILKGSAQGYLPELLRNIFLNIFLVQSWVPDCMINVSLNGVAWFLSTILFLYFCFPFIASWCKKRSRPGLITASAAAILLSYAICIPWMSLVDKGDHAFIWFSYCFPVFRLVDFFCGCCLAKIIAGTPSNPKSFFRGSLEELAAIVLSIGVFVWMKNVEPESAFLVATQNYTTIYVPLSIIYIYIFLKPSGFFTKALTNRLTIFIGNISATAFLTHYIITIATDSLLSFLGANLSTALTIAVNLLEFVITIILSIIYIRLEQKLRKRQSL